MAHKNPSQIEIEQKRMTQIALYLRDQDNAPKKPVDESLRYLISGVPVFLNGWKRGAAGK